MLSQDLGLFCEVLLTKAQHPGPEKQAPAFAEILLWVDLANHHISRAEGKLK